MNVETFVALCDCLLHRRNVMRADKCVPQYMRVSDQASHSICSICTCNHEIAVFYDTPSLVVFCCCPTNIFSCASSTSAILRQRQRRQTKNCLNSNCNQNIGVWRLVVLFTCHASRMAISNRCMCSRNQVCDTHACVWCSVAPDWIRMAEGRCWVYVG